MGYKDNIVVDTKYIASIDGGDKLANLIKNCGFKNGINLFSIGFVLRIHDI